MVNEIINLENSVVFLFVISLFLLICLVDKLFVIDNLFRQIKNYINNQRIEEILTNIMTANRILLRALNNCNVQSCIGCKRI